MLFIHNHIIYAHIYTNVLEYYDWVERDQHGSLCVCVYRIGACIPKCLLEAPAV